MSGGCGAEAESGRARPLSAGLWTLFAWLRRDEHSSTESVSSAGSDRTAASFAFFEPAHYSRAGAAPAARPPPSPPSDSYRRRVRERSLRRQRDRDLTLHRKYGLYGLGFDASSLPAPPGRRPEERERRAASESPRAHVPGKRRAPPPPAAAATLPRRRARKRPAPPPPSPARLTATQAAAAAPGPMSRPPVPDERPPRGRDEPGGCKPEKYSKKDNQTKETKDVKIRHEKSFLKQIFENKKRNSAIETASVKLLPNISELDKQAAEMIEKYRLKEMTPSERGTRKNESTSSSKRQPEAWICTRCLRKYDSSVITCNSCLPLNKSLNDFYKNSKMSNSCTQTKGNFSSVASGSSSANFEDKEKLKEILKEMKDSLPKRPKSEFISPNKIENTREMETKEDYPKTVEPTTLRIGSSICVDKISVAEASASGIVTDKSTSQLVPQNINKANKNALTTINSVIITQPVVLVHTKESNVVVNEKANKENSDQLLPFNNIATKSTRDSSNLTVTETERINPTNDPKPLNIISKTKYDLNTPLKISSLLNPIYIPKTTSTTNTETKLVKQMGLKDNKIGKACTTFEMQPNDAENTENLVPPPQSISKTPETYKDDKLKSETKKKLESNELAQNEKNTQVPIINAKSKNNEIKTNNNLVKATPTNLDRPSTSKDDRIDQHARRRDLINQLERSIAKGDEKAAAEAAVKLAQLKLSCSVLSFSSQIVAEPSSSSSPITPQQMNVSISENDIKKIEAKKIDEVAKKSAITDVRPVEVVSVKLVTENVIKQNIDKQPISTVKESGQGTKNMKPNASVLPKVESAIQSQPSCEVKNTVLKKLEPNEPSASKGGSSKKENDDVEVAILVWVEDKEATRGPVQLHVRRDADVGWLRRRAERSLGLAARLQRWIVGRALCSDDSAPLVALAGPDLSAPFYLCLVESDARTVQKTEVDLEVKEDPGNVYNELVKLEKQPLVSNTEVFECGVCIEECRPGGGVVLRECVHSFCKECLSDVVRHSEEPVVACPAMGCRGVLQEREIRGLVSPDDYETWLARGLAAAESGTRNSFHCRTRDCTGWALCDPGVRRFPCPVCKRTNCVPCQAIHEGESCEQHRTKAESTASPDASQTDEGTRALLNSLIARGEALECPECSAVITKKWGCDWIKCSACKTEICWVTRGRRWGPAGRGDTSAGCRCGVDGKRCHPSCGYCH